MLKILTVFLFLLSLPSYALEVSKNLKTLKSSSHVKLVVNKLDKRYMEKILRDFVKCCRPARMVGTSGHNDVAPFLINKIKELDPKGSGVLIVDPFKPDVLHGMELYQQDFKKGIEGKYPPTDPEYLKWKGFTDSMVNTLKMLKGVEGKNIIWEKKGYIDPKSVITIGAHYDTIAHHGKSKLVNPSIKQPGADDNGSAVAIALGLIEILAAVDTPKTVRVVFFDFEEIGFLGSRAYVRKYRKQMKDQKFAGYINLEMLGHDTKRQDKEKKFGNFKAYIRKGTEPGHSLDKKLYERLNKIGSKMTTRVKFKLQDNGFNSSDHINFWGEGFPAVTFTQNWETDRNPRYHTSDDFVETLNLTTWYASYQYISGAVLSWVFDIL